MDCKEKILSENYVDIIEESILFENLQKNLKDFCVQRISDNISNIYVNKKSKSERGVALSSVFYHIRTIMW